MSEINNDNFKQHINPPLRYRLIKGVIFDLDGTIADTLPLCIEAFRLAIEPLAQKQLTDKEIIATFGPSEEGTIMALAPHHYEEGLSGYLQFYEALHIHCPVPFDGIVALLDYLQHYNVRLAMVTGKGEKSTVISLRQFGITQHFSIVKTGSPAGPVKAECIAEVLQEWNDLQKEEVVYIGDAPSDINASRKAGIPVVSAAWAATADAEKLLSLQPDALFYSVGEFSAWLTEHIHHHS
ncbi:MAG TPA: HAD family hydrolase [Chitinophagaceae bacterium]|nr:HAD family hydrolase [Chitinophagaceae bacterium]